MSAAVVILEVEIRRPWVEIVALVACVATSRPGGVVAVAETKETLETKGGFGPGASATRPYKPVHVALSREIGSVLRAYLAASTSYQPIAPAY